MCQEKFLLYATCKRAALRANQHGIVRDAKTSISMGLSALFNQCARSVSEFNITTFVYHFDSTDNQSNAISSQCRQFQHHYIIKEYACADEM